MIRFLVFILTLSVLAACADVETRHQELDDTSSAVPAALQPNAAPIENPVPLQLQAPLPPVAPPTAPATSQVAVILGPGGLYAFAHIGVLQELTKSKIPISSIAGIELSALPAAIYAQKAQTYDVEWQMMKIHEDEIFRRGFLSGSGPRDIEALEPFLKSVFGATTIEESKIPFFCGSSSQKDPKANIATRGKINEVLAACLPYAPFYRSNNDQRAAITDLGYLVQFLRARGASYIIYVDSLADKNSKLFLEPEGDENAQWHDIAQRLKQQSQGIDKIIEVHLGNIAINDFTKRREMIQKGRESGRANAQQILTELGL